MPAEAAPELDLAEIIDDDLPSLTPKPPAPAPAPRAEAVSPPPPPPPAEKKYAHTAILLREAAKFGYTADVLAEYPAETVWEELHRLKELAAAPKPAGGGSSTPTPAAAIDPDDEVLAEWESVDKRGADYLRRQREEMKAIKAALKERDDKIEALTKNEQQRQAQSWQDKMAAAFAPHKAALGTGDVATARKAAVTSYLAHLGATKQATTLEADVAKAVTALGFAAAPGVNTPIPDPEPAPTRRLPPKNPANGRFTTEEFNAGLLHRPDGGDASNTDDLSDAEMVRRRRREHGDPRGDRRTFASDDDSDMPFTEKR